MDDSECTKNESLLIDKLITITSNNYLIATIICMLNSDENIGIVLEYIDRYKITDINKIMAVAMEFAEDIGDMEEE